MSNLRTTGQCRRPKIVEADFRHSDWFKRGQKMVDSAKISAERVVRSGRLLFVPSELSTGLTWKLLYLLTSLNYYFPTPLHSTFPSPSPSPYRSLLGLIRKIPFSSLALSPLRHPSSTNNHYNQQWSQTGHSLNSINSYPPINPLPPVLMVNPNDPNPPFPSQFPVPPYRLN